MKHISIFMLFIAFAFWLSAGVVITRNEIEIISKELYHENLFAEIINDRMVTIWDFNAFELTLINHQLQIYTTIGFEDFKHEMQRQNQAQIDSELRRIPSDTRQKMAQATIAAYDRMSPRFMLVDTLDVHSYKSFEYHIYNGNVITQKLWISKALQERIDREVNPLQMKQIETVLKENRQRYFDAMGIYLDPVTEMVEAIEAFGYITRRVDFGMRGAPDPEFETEMENLASYIADISETQIDPAIFTYHHRYRRVSYNVYQVTVMRHEMSKESEE